MKRKRSLLFAVIMLLCLIFAFQGAAAWSPAPAREIFQAQDPSPGEPPPTESPFLPPASESHPAAGPILGELSRLHGIDPQRLVLSFIEHYSLPLTGADFDFAKVVDVQTGQAYSIGLDSAGQFVDPDALRGQEKAASIARFGKLHPVLYNHLQSLQPDEPVRVSIWLDMGGRDASLQRLDPRAARTMAEKDRQMWKAEGVRTAAQVHRAVEQPLIDFLPSVSGVLISAAETAPLVFAEVPAHAIQQIAALPYVQVIDLLVTGGPEQDPGEDKSTGGGPELETVQAASKSNIVHARGYSGTGIIAAVVEGDSIQFSNPYLSGSCGPTTTCPSLDEHAAAVGGILASTHTTSRGVAPAASLRSANGGGWDLSHHQAATTWALNQGAHVLNNSYFLETDGAMHNSDRWLDYIVRVYWDVEVKSAGNLGETSAYITSPGLGYNVITVGAAEDKNTITWADDAMAELSSYAEPAGREKPEVTAVGCGEWIPGFGSSPGIISTGQFFPWIYDQGCGTSYAAPVVAGAAALLTQRDPGLETYPEAVKAILIATALHNIEGSSQLSEMDGAGAVDLAAADTLAANRWWHELTVTPAIFDAANNFTVHTYTFSAGERVRIALSYMSNPNASYTSDPLEGDLDIYLLNSASQVVASSMGTDSWEIIEFTVPATGSYTIRLTNHAGSYSGSEMTYAAIAVWPGHYFLSPQEAQTRDKPPGGYHRDSGDDYRFYRGAGWNAMGIRSPVGGDYDVFLFNNSVYGNPSEHTFLSESKITGRVDFVVIDGNHAPIGNYYATVSPYSGSGDYPAQHGTNLADLTNGSYGPYTMSPSQVVLTWDTVQNAGVRKYYAVRPSSGNADLGMGLFLSDQTVATSWYQGRTQSVAFVDTGGSGASELLSYQAAANDRLGLVVWSNSATTNTTFMLYADTSAPAGSVLVQGGAAYTNSTAVTLSLTGADPETGVYQMRFSNDNAAWSAWETFASTKAWSLTAGDGTKTVYVQVKNNADMSSATFSDTIIFDATPPTGSITVNSGANYASSTSVTLSLTSSDTASGVTHMRFSNNNTTWSSWEIVALTKAWTLSTGDGTKTVYVQYRDAAGNASGSLSDAILLDTTPPSGSVLINSGSAYTGSTSVALSLSASDSGSGVAQMRLSNNDSTWTSWETFSSSRTWSLLASDGVRTVYVQYRDHAGVASGSFSDVITLDTTPPTGSVVINAGAAWTSSPTVALTLSAADAGSGVSLMRISNDNLSWADWESYTTTKPWNLTTGEGVKNVYVQYQDNVGFTSGSKTSTISLDTTPPTSSATAPSSVSSLSFTVSWSGADSLSGVSLFAVQYREGASGSWVSWLETSATSAVFGPSLPVATSPGKTYYFRVAAIDAAGNREEFRLTPDCSTTITQTIRFHLHLPLIVR